MGRCHKNGVIFPASFYIGKTFLDVLHVFMKINQILKEREYILERGNIGSRILNYTN